MFWPVGQIAEAVGSEAVAWFLSEGRDRSMGAPVCLRADFNE